MSKQRGLEILSKLYDDDRPDIVLASMDSDFAIEEDTEDGDITIQGLAITEQLIESRRMIVKMDAFKHKAGFSLFNGRMLYFHNQEKEPIGTVTSKQLILGTGLFIEAKLWKENSELFKRAVREKKLRAMSIGFTIDRWEYDEKKDIVTVLEARLKEISVVNIGADSKALFEVTNSLKENETNNPTNITQRSNTLPDPKKFDAEQFMTDQEKLGVKVEELQNILESVRTTQTQANEKLISKSELAERLETFTTALNAIKEDVDAVKTQNSISDQRLAYKDYRSLITDFVWLTDDNGNKLGNIAQRAYCLFQMPVDYENMDNGFELRNLRNLYDATLIADAMARHKGRDRHSIQKLDLYKQLISATEKFDKDVSLAMAGGNSGFGAEWVPEELSSEFNEILRTQPRLASFIQTWNMPKGGSAKFPFQNGKAVVYKGGEALVDNAEEARKTNIATGVKTFTPDVFIGALVSSEELTEDAILDMISFIRNELSVALLEGLESAMINGDDSGTHFDNTVDTVYQSYNVETTFKGFRKLGIANARDIEASSSSTGVNALELVNFTDAKQDLGVAGLNPADCVYVTGIKGRTQVQQALFKEDALGVLSFMISGTLPTIDGSTIYVSGQYDEQLSSAGIRDSGADVKHTSMCCVHKPSFRIGQRRGVTLEFNKNILTQQQQFVATARWDFGKVSADSIEPVSSMINMQHTT